MQLDAELTPVAGQAAVSEHAGLSLHLSCYPREMETQAGATDLWRNTEDTTTKEEASLEGSLNSSTAVIQKLQKVKKFEKTQDTQVICNSGFSEDRNSLKFPNKEHHVRT